MLDWELESATTEYVEGAEKLPIVVLAKQFE